MKLYIAGIDIIEAPHNPLMKTQHLIDSLSQIVNDAKLALGNEVVTLIVLSEYELTSNSITKKLKNECINLLQEAVKKYKNLIFIPGSFSSYQKLSEYSNIQIKKKNILDNYMKNYPRFIINSNGNQFIVDNKYTKSYEDALLQLSTAHTDDIFCLQNSSYIISSTSDTIIKHKKSSPFDEKNKLSSIQPSKYIYDIDADNHIKYLTLNTQKLGIHLIICREHCIPLNTEIKSNPPALEVITSNTISTYKAFLYGAVNAHMDKLAGLKVHINDRHPKISMFNAIRAANYTIHSKNNKIVKNHASLTYFNSDFITASKPIYILNNGLSPLHCAVLTNKESIASHLLSNGANASSVDNDLNTVAHFAAENDNVNVLSELVKVNHTIANTPNKHGDTPLGIAHFRKSTRCIEFLLYNDKKAASLQCVTSINIHNDTKEDTTDRVEIDQEHTIQDDYLYKQPTLAKTSTAHVVRSSFSSTMNFWKTKDADNIVTNKTTNQRHSKLDVRFYRSRSTVL